MRNTEFNIKLFYHKYQIENDVVYPPHQTKKSAFLSPASILIQYYRRAAFLIQYSLKIKLLYYTSRIKNDGFLLSISKLILFYYHL